MSTEFNSGLVDEINFLRTNPRRYSNKVLPYTKYFNGKILRIPGTGAGIKTIEGADAYREAVTFLDNHSRIEAFEASKGMCKIAEDLLKEVQRREPGQLSTIDMESIISKYGTFNGNFSRAIDFGGETPEQVLINLLVSDGDPSRGQRDSLLSTDLKIVGVANGTHRTYKKCTVIVTCTKFYSKNDKEDDREFFGKEPEKKEDVKKEKSDDNNVVKPRNVVMSGNKKKDEKLPPGVVAINKTEKIVIEGGKKQKVIKIVKEMEDGTKEMETVKEYVEE